LRRIASRAGKLANYTPHGATPRRRYGSAFSKIHNCFSKHNSKSRRNQG